MSVVDGIVSGLDTTSVIKQLMSIERQPVTRLQAKSDAADKQLQAWNDIKRAVGTLRDSSLTLARASTFSQTTASSSDTTLATVTAKPNTSATSASFSVVQLASAHTLMTGSTVGGATAAVGAGRVAAGVGLQSLGIYGLTVAADAAARVSDVTITAAGGSNMTVKVGDDSVTVDRSVASVTVGGLTFQVDPGGLRTGSGKAQVVATDDTTTASKLASSFTAVRANLITLDAANGDRRMVFTSPSTGEANELLLASNGLGATMQGALGSLDTVSEAKNSIISVNGGVQVERSTNDLNDVFDGLNVHLVKADENKTVELYADVDQPALAEQVANWLKSLNAALGLIDSKTGYNADTKAGGVLLGDSAVRSVRSLISGSMSQQVPGGTFTSMAQIGITVGRNGQYSLDEAKLKDAIQQDPAAVGALFARSASSSTSSASYLSATDSTTPGTYAVNITQAAARAETTGNILTTLGDDETLSFSIGSKSVSVALTSGQTAAQVVSTLNAAFVAQGLAASADLDDDGALRVRSDAYGSKTTLKVQSDRVGADATGLAGAAAEVETEYTGEDVAGTIDGVEATGSGLSLTATSGKAQGLRLEIAGGASGDIGTVTYDGGVAGSMLRSLGLTAGADALVTSVTNSITSQKSDLAKQIENWNDRLTSTEARIRKQFTNMENMLNTLKAQQNRLGSALSSLPSNTTTSA